MDSSNLTFSFLSLFRSPRVRFHRKGDQEIYCCHVLLSAAPPGWKSTFATYARFVSSSYEPVHIDTITVCSSDGFGFFFGPEILVDDLLDPAKGYLNKTDEFYVIVSIFPVGVPRKCTDEHLDPIPSTIPAPTPAPQPPN
jgi:hypothetical protein